MNRGLIYIYYYLACSLAGINALAQTNSIIIHLDKPYYVAGEIVHYKVYLPLQSALNKPTFQLAVYDGSGTIVDKSYLKKDRTNSVSGRYKIPYQATPGLYQLVMYAFQENRNKSVKMSHFYLPIYTDATSAQIEQQTPNMTVSHSETFGEQLPIAISIKEQVIHPRDLVSLQVDVSDSQGKPVKANLSVSITDLGLIGTGDSLPYRSVHHGQDPHQEHGEFSEYIPFSGQLEDQHEGQLLTFFMPISNKVYYTTTRNNGDFELLLPDFVGDQTLQYMGQFSNNIPIKAMEEPFVTVASTKLLYPSAIVNYLEESRRRKLIYQLFNQVEASPQYVTPELTGIYTPDREFDASDYPFADIPSFCKEISTPLKYVKGENGDFEFKMFNPEGRNFFFGNPLFIVDGQMTKDAAFLTSIDFLKIDQISLYYDNQALSNNFGFAGFSGVVMIYSKDKDLKVPQEPSTQEFTISGIQPKLAPDENVEPLSNSVPALKPQLLWKPSLGTNNAGRLELTYTQSDDISEFQIEVVAQSDDGRLGHGQITYQVVR